MKYQFRLAGEEVTLEEFDSSILFKGSKAPGQAGFLGFLHKCWKAIRAI